MTLKVGDRVRILEPGTGAVEWGSYPHQLDLAPEFYGTCPAGTPEDPLPATLPAGTRVLDSHDLVELVGGQGYICERGPDCCSVRASLLDWSRIPRQPKPPEATAVELANYGLGFDGPRECADCGKPIERFQECSRVRLGSDGIMHPVPGFFHARCPALDQLPSGTNQRAAAELRPDPYAAVRDTEVASYYGTTRANERYAARRAALTLDMDRPSGKARYAEHPSTWPSKTSTATWEDD